MKTYNKSDITEALNSLPFDVKTFNSHRKMSNGAIGFVDHLLVSEKGVVIFIEVKLKKDTLKKKQLEYKELLLRASMNNKHLYYFIIDEKNLVEVCEKVVKTIKEVNK